MANTTEATDVSRGFARECKYEFHSNMCRINRDKNIYSDCFANNKWDAGGKQCFLGAGS